MSDRALSDLKVLEYADFVSGPFCTKLLADLGAEVIKIEKPSTGDTARQTGPFPGDIPHLEKSGLFLYLNTNKRSITLDPATPAGAEIFRELVKTTDILVENRPPSTMEGLGLDYESLHRINPGLIMASVSAFGQSGPYSHRKANDLICCQMSGLSFHTPLGGVDSAKRPPLKPGGRQSEFISGSMAAAAAMFAVTARRTSGEGQHLDISQHESMAYFLGYQIPWYTYDPEGETYMQTLDRSARIWKTLPCRDGAVLCACRKGTQWKALLDLVAGDWWEKDERLKGIFDGEFDLVAFLKNTRDIIRPIIAEWTAQHTTAEAIAIGKSRDIPIIVAGGFRGIGYLQCKDGYVVCGCREEYQWRAFIGLVVGDDWEEDSRFKALFEEESAIGIFLANAAPLLQPIISEWAASRTREEVTLATQSRGIPIVPCNSIEDVFQSPHTKQRRFFVDIDHPQAGSLPYPGAPYHLSETPWSIKTPAPLLGQYNEEIFCRRLGYTEAELALMQASGTI